MNQSMADNKVAREYFALTADFDWMGAGDAAVAVRLEKMEALLVKQPPSTPLLIIHQRDAGEASKHLTVGEELANVQRHRRRTEKRLLENLGGKVANLRRALLVAAQCAC